MNDQEKERA